MTAETGQQQADTGQSANGRGPLPPDAPGDGTPVSERVMGILGIAAAIGLLYIGVDLAFGGSLSRALFGERADDAAG